jgi:hypothetical protein
MQWSVQALIWTLEKAIGKEWNRDLEEAWIGLLFFNCTNHVNRIQNPKPETFILLLN